MAFKRKLTALEYDKLHSFNIKDEKCFRSTVTWVEDKKIRHYNEVTDGDLLRDIENEAWPQAFERYLSELKCPHNIKDSSAVMDWLLGYAVRLEYKNIRNKYNALKKPETVANTSRSTNNDPLANIDFNDPHFKAGVASLAKLFQVPSHPDHLEQLKAICIIVQEKFSKEAPAKNNSSDNLKDFSLDKTISGLDAGSDILDEVSKILRLLHIKELRDLQTNINRIIVEAQAITANRTPKTDVSLGKVGRK